jgi:hypothetical protein
MFEIKTELHAVLYCQYKKIFNTKKYTDSLLLFMKSVRKCHWKFLIILKFLLISLILLHKCINIGKFNTSVLLVLFGFQGNIAGSISWCDKR